MQPELVGALVDGAVPFFAGIYATLLGFRVVGKRPGANLKYDEWHHRFGRHARLVGPCLVSYGLFLWITGIARVSSSSDLPRVVDWRRYTTSDGVCSAEFPEQPNQDTQSALGVVSNRLTLSLRAQEMYYSLSFSDLPAGAPPATDEERLDSLRDAMPAFGAQMGLEYEFVREDKITESGVAGRDLEFAGGEKYTIRTKVFILGNRIYRVNAVTPQGKKDDEETERFLSSFRFEKSEK